jgi:hypothetical protein
MKPLVRDDPIGGYVFCEYARIGYLVQTGIDEYATNIYPKSKR